VFSVSHEQLQTFRKLVAVSEPKPAPFHLEIFGAALGAGCGLGKLSAMGRSREALLLPWPDAQKHDYS
jgi:hypothetical protein